MNMKRIFILPIIGMTILISLAANAQKKGREADTQVTKPSTVAAPKPSNELEVKIYETALKYGDIEVARNAIYALLVKHPDSLNYVDTLARLYFSNGNYVQCALTSKDYLARDSANLFVREMLAISLSSLNKNKESLEQYEILYANTHSVFHAYQIAILQYVLKRFGECETTCAIILSDPKAGDQKVSISADEKSNQQVPIKAAAYNIRGVMYKEMNRPDDALNSFKEAVKIFPDFVLAKANIEAMTNPKKETTNKK
jgi:tetratricopeptide (TPR) repeat protein